MTQAISLHRTMLLALAVLAGALASLPARAGDVSVSIGIHQPGVYGRIDIGRYPRPQVVVQRPVVVVQQARLPPPVYLHVPPGHRKHWRKHCRAYGACAEPVYFVQERWYHTHVARAPLPGRDAHLHGRHRGGGHGHGRGHD